jgi:chemotaxis protein MotB
MQNERTQSPFRRKIGASGASEGAGMMRWLLTYADMITLLLALFIILFAISTISKVKFQALAKEISGGFNGPYAINNPPNGGATGQQPGRAGDADLDRVKQQVDTYVKERKLTDKVQTKITRQGLVISLLTDKALYESGSADLQPETRALIDEIGHIIRRNSNDIRVGGYTDDVPIATSEYPSNWELSAARATTVVRYLIDSAGVNPNRLSAAAYGEYHHAHANDSEADRRLNRKVDIVIQNAQSASRRGEN